ncbi:MAG: thioesterase family protein, partial [Pseudomonadota bacterium]
DDIPVRSAQVAFVGPVGGDVQFIPTLLRRGKNTAFVRVSALVGDATMAECLFAFGAARESRLAFSDLPMPDVPKAEDLPSFFASDRRPNFSRQFNVRQAIGDPPVSASENTSIGVWLRSVDENTPQEAASVLAIADCPPPAAMSMFPEPAPVSSMTWMAEFLSDDISTPDRWWFALHTAQTAADGYSSQSMRLWDSSGRPILVGRQTVAVFA